MPAVAFPSVFDRKAVPSPAEGAGSHMIRPRFPQAAPHQSNKIDGLVDL
jgi:hypothetical protein